ncbi:MAG: terminase small subunit, partial [Peptoniphilus sp.]|uniref:terminase small subunit n=1 Tax=Peptoniphilus sp. TaxID=1971214 RepID=UPI002A763734
INADRILQELGKLGFVNIADVVDLETGKVKDSASDEDLACIQSIKIKPTEWGTEREVKFYDKKSTLELMGKHLGMWTDKLEIKAESVVIVDDIED